MGEYHDGVENLGNSTDRSCGCDVNNRKVGVKVVSFCYRSVNIDLIFTKFVLLCYVLCFMLCLCFRVCVVIDP